MNQRLLLAVSAIAAIMIFAGASQEAEASGYLKLGDIKGESTDRAHPEWIDLLSVSHVIERDTNSKSSARQRSSATFGDLVLVKEVDASTPKLQEAIAKGTHFQEAKIDFTRSIGEGQQVTYLQWELKNVQITSYSFSGPASEEIPVDQVSLNFEKIKVTYTKYDRDGNEKGKIEYSWDIQKNKAP